MKNKFNWERVFQTVAAALMVVIIVGLFNSHGNAQAEAVKVKQNTDNIIKINPRLTVVEHAIIKQQTIQTENRRLFRDIKKGIELLREELKEK